MTQETLVQHLAAGGCRLAFDTNALFEHGRLVVLCTQLSRWNHALKGMGADENTLFVSAVAHCEKVFDIKQQYQGAFDPQDILQGMRGKGLAVAPFGEDEAVATAARLGVSYKDNATWYAAKKRRCLQCLGLNPARDSAPGSGRRCGATVDWLIGGHAERLGCIVVGDDTGEEWTGLLRARLSTLEKALKQLLGEAP